MASVADSPPPASPLKFLVLASAATLVAIGLGVYVYTSVNKSEDKGGQGSILKKTEMPTEGSTSDGASDGPEVFPPGSEFALSACAACPDPCSDDLKLPPEVLKDIDLKSNMKESKTYTRHLFITTGNGATWPAKVEKLPIIAHLNTLVKDSSKLTPLGITGSILFSAAESSVPESTGASDTESYQLMLFPENLSIGGVTLANAEKKAVDLLTYAAKKSGEKPEGLETLAEEKHIFVCVHKLRDNRCGVAGPKLMTALISSLASHQLQESVKVMGCSHVGGHKWAGNLIVYPKGTWLSRVMPYHANAIVEQVIVGGKVIKELWRGEMGWRIPAGSKKWWLW